MDSGKIVLFGVGVITLILILQGLKIFMLYQKEEDCLKDLQLNNLN